ncbi:glycoprotein-N-acetylgalactosamine 3-beta-galactosyltransferase 1-like isoform X1 [Diorhabda sublineata]|uniref:glycoprotein-N-acetylgalactosamine 3-beta-galactosyltransferase 1-like isoform X1 n=1 Tax=Diorhabda sublineata TaxID=1163346 RepID=UPI0024E0D63C|nr:glycoprotein-N-acetylgalactosamine 3-beta-galactosyltransferase 1-like isoform X1 [Diorhabda sublineata]
MRTVANVYSYLERILKSRFDIFFSNLQNMVHFYYRICLFFLGMTLGIIIKKSNMFDEKAVPIHTYDVWFKNQGLLRRAVSWDNLRYVKHMNKSVIESNFLFKKVTILCIILMKNDKYFKSIKETWANGCNTIQFIDIRKKKVIPIKRNNKNSSWVKLCLYLQDVAPFNPEQKHYLGHPVEFWKTKYNSVHSGIVISKGTVSAFKNAIKDSDCLFSSYWNREDYYLGKTLASLNITPVDNKDVNGYSVFYPGNLNNLIFHDDSGDKSDVFPIKCCSRYTISFQALDGDKMYTYYYLLYTLQLFTEGHFGNTPHVHENDDEVWKTFLKQRNVTRDYVTSAEYYKLWVDLIDDPISFAAKMKRETVDDT